MKTYLFDTINRYKRFSENLDVKTILCNKSWWVFNDSGEKELYIFKTDGSLLISISGQVSKGSWSYEPSNKSLLITSDSKTNMVHPAFKDNYLFALQLDGTDNVAFLIDEQYSEDFAPKNLSQLLSYFQEKERKALAIEAEKKAIEEEKERKRKEYQIRLEIQMQATKLREKLYKEKYYVPLAAVITVVIYFILYIVCGFILRNNLLSSATNVIVVLISLFIGSYLIIYCVFHFILPNPITKWKKDHPFDLLNKYL